jgi:hypothetical protein
LRRFRISGDWARRIALGVVCITLAAIAGAYIPLVGYALRALGLALMLPLKAGDY